MKFEELYQEVEMLRVLVVGMTVEQARSRPQPQVIPLRQSSQELSRTILNRVC